MFQSILSKFIKPKLIFDSLAQLPIEPGELFPFYALMSNGKEAKVCTIFLKKGMLDGKEILYVSRNEGDQQLDKINMGDALKLMAENPGE